MPFEPKRLTDLRFLIALSLLALNDHLLKCAWPGWITGKLSDFAGLYAFGWFCTALFPRSRALVISTIAFVFIWWKSPWSLFAVNAWNELGVWPVGRVEDLTDLCALTVLLLLVRPSSGHQLAIGRLGRFAVAASALLLFCSTSMVRRMQMPVVINSLYYADQDYKLFCTEERFWQVLDTLQGTHPLDTTRITLTNNNVKQVCLNHVRLRDVAAHSVNFSYEVRRKNIHLWLIAIDPDHPITAYSQEELNTYRDLYRRLFEQAILHPIAPVSIRSRALKRYQLSAP